jgi:predicted amidohydrolase YtcJ
MNETLAKLSQFLKTGEPCLLKGARVYTGDGSAVTSGSLAIERGRFVPLPTETVPGVDLKGWTLLPGLCDAHLHLFHEARRSLRVELGGVNGREELLERLQEAAAEDRVFGVDWDESEWDDPRLPTLAELDHIFPDKPLGLLRICGHVALANSVALRDLATGGHKVKPRGPLLLEQDVWPLARLFPPDETRMTAAVETVGRRLASQGLTAVTEMGSESLPRRCAALDERFPLRIEYFHVGPLSDIEGITSGERIVPLGRKFFLDGSIGGQTAAVSSPYHDGGQGELLWSDQNLLTELTATLDAGWMVALHTIGDRALDQALRLLTGIAPPAGKVRLEHLEIAGEKQLEQVVHLGLMTCMQPNFMDRWGRPGGLYQQRLGDDFRSRFTTPGTLRRLGIPLAYGTDGMPARLWPAMAAALDGDLFGEEPDTPLGTLSAVTADAARLTGQGELRGSVKEGLAADFCLLENDPVVDNFGEATRGVAMTVLAGRTTWITPRYKGR